MIHDAIAGADEEMELYCDALVLYLLVESTLGDCELYRELDRGLDTGDPATLRAAMQRYAALPEEVRREIQAGEVPFEPADAVQDDDPNAELARATGTARSA